MRMFGGSWWISSGSPYSSTLEKIIVWTRESTRETEKVDPTWSQVGQSVLEITSVRWLWLMKAIWANGSIEHSFWTVMTPVDLFTRETVVIHGEKISRLIDVNSQFVEVGLWKLPDRWDRAFAELYFGRPDTFSVHSVRSSSLCSMAHRRRSVRVDCSRLTRERFALESAFERWCRCCPGDSLRRKEPSFDANGVDGSCPDFVHPRGTSCWTSARIPNRRSSILRSDLSSKSKRTASRNERLAHGSTREGRETNDDLLLLAQRYQKRLDSSEWTEWERKRWEEGKEKRTFFSSGAFSALRRRVRYQRRRRFRWNNFSVGHQPPNVWLTQYSNPANQSEGEGRSVWDKPSSSTARFASIVHSSSQIHPAGGSFRSSLLAALSPD